jgi:predicted dithiol-disulfide oxidoreductase (DUF899 family)
MEQAMAQHKLVPATELAKSGLNYPNESVDYRKAREALLAEEIELRRHIERVAEMRRALPPGGQISENYKFVGESGPVTLSEMFGRHDTLIIYNFMYGPKMEKPCPMCTSLLAAWDGEALDIEQRAGFAMVAKSPIERLTAYKRDRGFRHLRMYSSGANTFNRDYHADGPNGEDFPALNVFTRRDGITRHFWGGEMTMRTADPEQDPRGAPDLMPLWTILDLTPDGRGKDWYPKLDYAA